MEASTSGFVLSPCQHQQSTNAVRASNRPLCPLAATRKDTHPRASMATAVAPPNIWGITPAPTAPRRVDSMLAGGAPPPSVHSDDVSVAEQGGERQTLDVRPGQWSFPRAWKALTHNPSQTKCTVGISAMLVLLVLLLVTSGFGVASAKHTGWNWLMVAVALILMGVVTAAFVMGGFPCTSKAKALSKPHQV